MNELQDMNSLDLEKICAGKPDAEATATPAAPGERLTLKQRVINMKRAFGLPPWMENLGIPKLLPD